MALSLVMPVYNEEGCIADSVAEVLHEVLDAVPSSELVIVNDGSRDRTGEILDKLARADARIRIVHQANAGHGAAVSRGADHAQGEYLFFVDSDQQIPLTSFGDLWRGAQLRDGAFGIRVHRTDPWHRQQVTRALRTMIRALFGVSLRDANAPFKIVRRSVWEAAHAKMPARPLIPSVLLAVYTAYEELDVIYLEVPHRPRSAGDTTLRSARLAGLCARALRELVAFRLRLGRGE